MRGSGDVVSWIKGSARWGMVMVAISAGTLVLRAEDPPVDTFHITEPAMANPYGDGWQVDPHQGRLSVTIPIGTMPGEISFPVSLTMNASPTKRNKRVLVGWSGGDKQNQPVYGLSTDTLPTSCNVNLPSITPTPTGGRFTLEDGRTYTGSDFKKTAQPFTDHTTTPAQLFSAYGFDQPSSALAPTSLFLDAEYGFRGWAVSTDGSLIMSGVKPPNNRYDSLIYSLRPSPDTLLALLKNCKNNFNPKTSISTSSINCSGFFLLMDKNRARVFVCFTYQNKDMQECTGSGSDGGCSTTYTGDTGTIYLPILILDRFGHYVTMQWSASETSGLGGYFVAGVRRVDVRNKRGQGFTVRMNNYSSDQARLDFVNVGGPSVLISGGGPFPYWVHQDPGTPFPKPEPKSTWSPESVGRPTQVTLGKPDTVREPSWSGTLEAPSFPPATLASDSSVYNRVWNLGYTTDGTTLTSIQDPMRVKSAFTVRNYSIKQSWNQFESNVSSTDLLAPPDTITGVSQVDQIDMSGKSTVSRGLTWDRQIAGSVTANYAIFVKHTDVWNPGVNQADRYTTYDFGGFSNPGGPLFNPTDFGNGFLNHWALVSSATDAALASQDRVSRTVKTNNNYSKGSGLNGYLSIPQSTVDSRQGEISRQKVYSYVDDTSLQTSTITTFVSPNGSAPWIKIHEHSFSYNNLWNMLETQQIAQSITARFNPAGAQLTPDFTTNTWDSANPPLLQLLKTYRNNSGLQHGSKFTYDDQGRLSTQGIHHSEGGAVLASPNTLTMTYDDTVTGRPIKWSTAFQDGSTTSTLVKTQGDFDSGHRPQLAVDEKGVSTHTTYDFFGRPLIIARDGEAAITISYPDEWTKITTQAGKTTTENYDGFGRLIEQILPDGTRVVPTYDLHSRVIKTTETNKVGIPRTSTTDYDLLDRVTSQTSFTGKRVEFTYSTDGFNNVVTQTVDPLGLKLVTVTKKDPFGQVVSVKAPNGDMTSYTYDGHGNKTQVTITPFGGGTAQNRFFYYDLLDRLISKKEPETGTQEFNTFNALNQAQTLKEVGIDPANGSRTRTLVYDGLGRLRSQTGVGVAETFTYQGSFLTNTTRSVGTDVVTQTFAYKGPGAGARLSQESTTSQVMGQ